MLVCSELQHAAILDPVSYETKRRILIFTLQKYKLANMSLRIFISEKKGPLVINYLAAAPSVLVQLAAIRLINYGFYLQ